MSHVASILILLLRLRTSKSALGVSLKVRRSAPLPSFVLLFSARRRAAHACARTRNTHPRSPPLPQTQELFLLVFVTRYIDLFTAFYSIYNSIMKVRPAEPRPLALAPPRRRGARGAERTSPTDAAPAERSGRSPTPAPRRLGHATRRTRASPPCPSSPLPTPQVLYIASTAYIVYMIRHQEPYKSKYDRSQDSFLHWKYAAAPAALVSLATVALQRNFDVVEILWTFSIYLEPLAIIPQLIVLQRYKEVENLTGNYIFFMGSYRALYILNWVYRSYYEPYYRHHWIVYACGIAQTALYIDFFYYFVTAKYYGQKLSLPT